MRSVASTAFEMPVQIDVYAAEPAPMGVAGPEVSSAVKQLLASKDIPYHPEHQVTTVDASTKLLMFINGTCAEFDLLATSRLTALPTLLLAAALSIRAVGSRSIGIR